jgi:ferric-dicitrate binding protein FerR (iron transport regulator)
MDNIYDILSKHFLKETSEEEEKLVFEFKQSNLKEYKMLKEIWNREGLKIHDFDSVKGWKEFSQRIKRKPQKTIQIYRRIRQIAAAVLFLLFGSITVIYLTGRLQSHEKVIAENNAGNLNELELEDGSVIWLNKGATLSYPEKFTGDTRYVKLSGEAYFEVARDERHPFIVTTDNSEITVLGTSFNVNSTSIHTQVSVVTGKVQVASNTTKEQIILDPNQAAIITRGNIIRFETTNQNFLAWKTGIFEFLNTPIEQVVLDLNTYYDNRIEIDTSEQFDCNLTARFSKADLTVVMEIIQTTCDLVVEESGNSFKIK